MRCFKVEIDRPWPLQPAPPCIGAHKHRVEGDPDLRHVAFLDVHPCSKERGNRYTPTMFALRSRAEMSDADRKSSTTTDKLAAGAANRLMRFCDITNKLRLNKNPAASEILLLHSPLCPLLALARVISIGGSRLVRIRSPSSTPSRTPEPAGDICNR